MKSADSIHSAVHAFESPSQNNSRIAVAQCVAAAFVRLVSGWAEAPGCDFAPWCAPLPAASAALCQGSLPAGCRPAAQCVFGIAFAEIMSG
ncbi:MAG: hypothetical protein RLZZ436_2263, partial [Planctomycetota bacterium]